MLRPGFLCTWWPRGRRVGTGARPGSALLVALVLLGQGKAPAPEWPICPSPVEVLPERELFALRKQFRGAWLPPRSEAGAPPECQLAFHDREWTETQVPGLAAPLRAAWQPGQRLVLRRVFTLNESRKRTATLHLPACAGTLRVWFDGAPLPVPTACWTPTELDLPEGIGLGPHVLCLEVLATQANPVWGELFVSRSERARLTDLRAAVPTATAGNALLAAVATQAGAAPPLPLELQLWRVGSQDLKPLDQTSMATLEATGAFRVRGAWRPGVPENFILRAVLTGRGGPADVRVLGVAPRGYRVEPDGVRVGNQRVPLFTVAAALTPAPDLPDQVQARIARWRAAGANAVLTPAPVHPSLLDAADRLGLLVLLEAPDRDAVAALERAWSSHPSLCGFVVPLDTGAVTSGLPVWVRTDQGLVRPGATDATGALLTVPDHDNDLAARWAQAESQGAAGLVLPEGQAPALRALRR